MAAIYSDDENCEVSDAGVSDDAFSKPDDGFHVEKRAHDDIQSSSVGKKTFDVINCFQQPVK